MSTSLGFFHILFERVAMKRDHAYSDHPSPNVYTLSRLKPGLYSVNGMPGEQLTHSTVGVPVAIHY